MKERTIGFAPYFRNAHALSKKLLQRRSLN